MARMPPPPGPPAPALAPAAPRPEAVEVARRVAPPKLFGRLEGLLPYGLRIRRAWSDGEADFFVAPLTAVEAAVLSKAHADPYVSPARPGFRAPRKHIHVWFAPAGCSADPSGPLRAEAVRLMTEAELLRVSARQEALLATKKAEEAAAAAKAAAAAAIASEKAGASLLDEALVPMELMATDPGQSLMPRERDQKLEHLVASWADTLAGEHVAAEIDFLQKRSNEAVEAGDGEALCDCLVYAIAGLKAWAARHKGGAAQAAAAAAGQPRAALGATTWVLAAAAGGAASEPPPPPESGASPSSSLMTTVQLPEEHRRVLKAGLWAVVSSALGALDLDSGAVRARLLPTVTHLCSFLAEPSAAGSIGRLRWRRISSCVRTVLKSAVPFGPKLAVKPPKSVCLCSVADCVRPAAKLVTEEDRFGKPGYRCYRHGARGWCNVPGCYSKGHGKVWVADEFGEAGKRCIRHNARKCIVPGCVEPSVVRLFAADRHGPPGRRCHRHGGLFVKTCSAYGCFNRPRRYVDAADEFGPPGRRCPTHGGARCNIYGCRNNSWGKAYVSDEWGPPGTRCYVHGGVTCNVLHCTNRPIRKVTVQDKLGPAGPRCRFHSKDRRAHARNAGKPLEDLPQPKRQAREREVQGPAVSPEAAREGGNDS